ncbi:MAG: energy transducer TonB [Fluviicola sp.]
MVLTLSIMAIIVAFSLYDYFSSRSWQAVTSRARNETVFENRNKEYGAYQIRRDYDKRILLVFLGFTVGIGAIWGASNLLKPLKQKEDIVISTDNFTDIFAKEDEIPDIPEEKIIEAAPPASLADITEFRVPVVEDDPVKNPDLGPIDPDKEIGKEKQIGDPDADPFDPNKILVKEKGTGRDGTEKLPPLSGDPETYVDEPAQFPGGMDALREFIRENIDLSMIDGSAKVNLKFVVDTDGTISSVIVTKTSDDCKSCEKAAIKVVKSMPNWKPGKLNGREVKSYYRLPINIQ